MMSIRSAVSRVVRIRPRKPSLISMGIRPVWSMWAWVTRTKSMSFAAKGKASLDTSSRPCCNPQSTRMRLPPTSRQWQLPVTHWSAP